MNVQAKTVRFAMMMEPERIRLVDEWRFRNKISTRAQACRMLIEQALQMNNHDALLDQSDTDKVAISPMNPTNKGKTNEYSHNKCETT